MSGNMATVLAENYQLKWHSHSTHLHTSVATLYRSDNFTDVTLVTTDGRFLAAHKFVLSACSSYLNRILQISRLGSNSNVVIVLPPEITYRTLAILLQYMYSGEATVSNDQLNGVLKAGEILRIKGLCHNKEKRPSSESHGLSRKDMVNGESLKQVYVNVKNKSNNLLKIPEMHSTPSSTITSPEQGSKQQSLLKTVLPSNKAAEGKPQPDRMADRENSCESSKDSNTPGNSNSGERMADIAIEESMKIELLVKEEPLDWDDHEETCETVEEMDPDIAFKVESHSPGASGDVYAPLTCDMCQVTFTTPALWVRHIETHTPTDVPRKRRKRNTVCNWEYMKDSSTEVLQDIDWGQPGEDQDEDCEFPPLRCELCQEVFIAPGEWVRHIQSAHTEEQLASRNSSSGGAGPSSRRGKPSTPREPCPSCTKTFPSHASMLIHSRTHTGEKPYICCVCEKGFNVKSNLLRHLRTLHDHIMNPGDAN